MKTIVKLLMIVLIAFFIGWLFLGILVLQTKESKIGNSIVLNNDTLLIIDYSILKNTYSLENNLEVDANSFLILE